MGTFSGVFDAIFGFPMLNNFQVSIFSHIAALELKITRK